MHVNKQSIIWEIELDVFRELVSKSSTYVEVLKKLSLNPYGGANITLRNRIVHENIDTSHFKQKRINKTYSLNEILIKNSTYTNRTKLKERLLKNSFLENKCYECGINNNWNGKPLSLQLEHINGINNDNRIENLILLCPNCHSQTDTFAGKKNKKYINCIKCLKPLDRQPKTGLCAECYKPKKVVIAKIPNTCYLCNNDITNKSKSGLCITCSNKNRDTQRKVQNRPSRIELIELILNKPFTQIGADFNVSDNAIRKWCIAENLPHRSKDIKAERETIEKELKEHYALA
jgi:hypothetical protein